MVAQPNAAPGISRASVPRRRRHASSLNNRWIQRSQGSNVRSEVGLGPVASRLVEHASGCVLVGREPPGDRQARILVPLDGSDGSQQALDALVSLFDIESAEIKLLHVVETLWLPVDEEPGSGAAKDPEA